MPMFDVACVGILVADVVARTVRTLPEAGKLTLTDHLDLHTGGCAASSAIDMARLGLRTAVSGKIGADGFGAYMRQALRANGVEDAFVMDDPKEGTSASVVLVDAQGERSFLHCLGANGTFTDSDVPDALLSSSSIVFVAGTMLMPSFDGEPCARVLQRARRLNKATALDTAWDSKGRWMDILRPCMSHLDFFLPSYDEAVELSGEHDPERIAQLFLDMGVGTVVIKLGPEGCLVQNRDISSRVPGYAVPHVMDTTGAGDAFCAGFLTGVVQGRPLEICGKMGNAVGALCVSGVGASSGIRSMDQVREIMQGH